ncbi:MAG: redoxin domain-containing protein [Ignavibacteriales bacterium]|nr:redoxin domain-containing protein [Ignavibacteriales bacterium]
MSLKLGDAAPNFNLKSHTLEDISLSQFKNKSNVIILFFPFVNTATCEKELCTIRDGMAKYNDLNAEVLAISVDSPFSQKLWAEKNRFNFPVLSDFNKEVCQNYGAYYDVFAPGKFDYKGVAKRSAFIVNKAGIIKYIEILEDPSKEPDYEAIQKVLSDL